MRMTLTIDDDVAAILERLRHSRDASLKDLINEALRRGLGERSAPPERGEPFRIRSVDLGTPLLPNIDNIADVVAIIEGAAYK